MPEQHRKKAYLLISPAGVRASHPAQQPSDSVVRHFQIRMGLKPLQAPDLKKHP